MEMNEHLFKEEEKKVVRKENCERKWANIFVDKKEEEERMHFNV